MIIDTEQIINMYENLIKSSFFDENGRFKFFKTNRTNEFLFDITTCKEEHDNLPFVKKTVSFGDFEIYSFNSNDYINGGLLLIDSVSGKVAIVFSILLSSSYYTGVITSRNFENFKTMFKENEVISKSFFDLPGFEFKLSTLDFNQLSLALKIERDVSFVKQNTKILNLAMSTLQDLTAFQTTIPETLLEYINEKFDNLEQRIIREHWFYNINRDFTDSELKIAVINLHIYSGFNKFSRIHNEEFINLDIKNIIPEIYRLTREKAEESYKNLLTEEYRFNDWQLKVINAVAKN